MYSYIIIAWGSGRSNRSSNKPQSIYLNLYWLKLSGVYGYKCCIKCIEKANNSFSRCLFCPLITFILKKVPIVTGLVQTYQDCLSSVKSTCLLLGCMYLLCNPQWAISKCSWNTPSCNWIICKRLFINNQHWKGGKVVLKHTCNHVIIYLNLLNFGWLHM